MEITNRNIKYKKTGLNWMPEVPEHWEVRRLKTFVDYVNRGNTPNYVETSEFKVVNQATFSKGFWDESNLRFSDFGEKELKGKIQKNDILLASTGGGVLGKTYLFNFESKNYVADSHVTIIRDRKKRFVPAFLYYILSINYKLINGILAEGSTNQTELQKDWLLNLKIALPPLSEQDSIVQYIKVQEEKINLFIQKKQRFIELLKEQRQSVIHQVVTKGLNQKVKLKSSGIEWLGDIPTHWEIRRLKECLIGKLKYGANESGEEYNPTWYRYIRITDFSLDGKLSKENKLSLSPEIGTEYELQDGDILFARSGATVGKTFQFHYVSEEEKYCYAGYLIKGTPDKNIILSDFLFNYTNSKAFENWKNSIFNKATIENIGADKYSVLKIPIPPIEEQKQIVSHIKTETATIDTAIAKTEREIELIREYKEAMISEAVMGKRNKNNFA